MLKMRLKKDENLREDRVRGKETGKTNTNYRQVMGLMGERLH
jgi:hypothetical protein